MNLDFDWTALHLEAYVVHAAAALAILVVGWMIAAWIGRAVGQATQRSGRMSPTLVPVFAKLTRLAILAIVVVAALNELGVETSGLFAMLGAAGLAIGLALKDTVADVAAGIVLLILRPFDVGEAVDIGGTGGIVQGIDIFQTRLTSFGGIPIVINNSAIRTSIVQNYSRAERRRIDLDIGIGYGDDIGKAIAVIDRLLEAEARVLRDPAWLVNTKLLGDSAVVLLVRCTTKAADFEKTKFDLTRAIKEGLDHAGISIPFPQRDVHMVLPQAA